VPRDSQFPSSTNPGLPLDSPSRRDTIPAPAASSRRVSTISPSGKSEWAFEGVQIGCSDLFVRAMCIQISTLSNTPFFKAYRAEDSQKFLHLLERLATKPIQSS
jgi:hypothetical protein